MLKNLCKRVATRFTIKKNINPYMKAFMKYHRWTKDPEIADMLSFMKRHNQFNMMNCELSKSYKPDEVEVKHDENASISYVMYEGKKLYFPKGRSEEKIRNAYVALLKEQDPYSPHRYLSTQDMEDIARYKNSGGGNTSI